MSNMSNKYFKTSVEFEETNLTPEQIIGNAEKAVKQAKADARKSEKNRKEFERAYKNIVKLAEKAVKNGTWESDPKLKDTLFNSVKSLVAKFNISDLSVVKKMFKNDKLTAHIYFSEQIEKDNEAKAKANKVKQFQNKMKQLMAQKVEQPNPKFLADGYFYNGTDFDFYKKGKLISINGDEEAAKDFKETKVTLQTLQTIDSNWRYIGGGDYTNAVAVEDDRSDITSPEFDVDSLSSESKEALKNIKETGEAKVLTTKLVGKSLPEVKLVQELLNDVNGADLNVDGKYGKNTASAVEDYQFSYELESNGIVDNETWKKLLGIDKDLSMSSYKVSSGSSSGSKSSKTEGGSIKNFTSDDIKVGNTLDIAGGNASDILSIAVESEESLMKEGNEFDSPEEILNKKKERILKNLSGKIEIKSDDLVNITFPNGSSQEFPYEKVDGKIQLKIDKSQIDTLNKTTYFNRVKKYYEDKGKLISSDEKKIKVSNKEYGIMYFQPDNTVFQYFEGEVYNKGAFVINDKGKVKITWEDEKKASDMKEYIRDLHKPASDVAWDFYKAIYDVDFEKEDYIESNTGETIAGLGLSLLGLATLNPYVAGLGIAGLATIKEEQATRWNKKYGHTGIDARKKSVLVIVNKYIDSPSKYNDVDSEFQDIIVEQEAFEAIGDWDKSIYGAVSKKLGEEFADGDFTEALETLNIKLESNKD
jgi:hypothetical protein